MRAPAKRLAWETGLVGSNPTPSARMKQDAPVKGVYFSIPPQVKGLSQVCLMSRAPFQVLVLPFRHNQGGQLEYAVFRRRDEGYWQFIAGGGENNEKPIETAI